MALCSHAKKVFEQAAFPPKLVQTLHPSVQEMQVASDDGGRNTFSSGSGIESAFNGSARGFSGGGSAADAPAQARQTKRQTSAAQACFKNAALLFGLKFLTRYLPKAGKCQIVPNKLIQPESRCKGDRKGADHRCHLNRTAMIAHSNHPHSRSIEQR